MVPFVFFWTKKKVKLASLKPDTDTTKITLKVKEKKEFPCTGISYLSNVKYSSDNKKVAKVNSSGEIQAKKPVQLISGVKLNSMAILTISSAR